MQNGFHRLEVDIPKKGNGFLPMSKIKDRSPIIRIIGGRSFASGFETVLFDGVIQFQIKLNCKPAGKRGLLESANSIVLDLRSMFPDKIVEWAPESKTIEMNLLEEVTMPVSESSILILRKIARKFGISTKELLKQNQWSRKNY